MSVPTRTEEDPFAPVPPDEEAELEALARALRTARGFTLLLACCNQAEHRDRLMDALEARLAELRLQRIPVREPVPHLLDLLRERLETPPPSAVFVYGMEAWLTSGEEAERSPFILNLNAARNYFPDDMPCPLVLWLPQHLMAAVARGAPDFCSVRSGIFFFAATAEARERLTVALTTDGEAELQGLAYREKLERVRALEELLREYEALPPEFRDPEAELRLMDSLAQLYLVLDEWKAADSWEPTESGG
jgi:hypothetical protein